MAHYFVVGMTESGKTSFAKAVCRQVKQLGYPTAVLDPLRDSGWDTDNQFDDPSAFLAFVRSRKSHVLFIDEGGTSIGRYNAEMQWLATTSRHWGHSCYFLSQKVTQTSPIVREQSQRFYVFACGLVNLALIAEETREPELVNYDKLDKGEFLIVSRFDTLRKGRVFWVDGKPKVEYDNVE